MGIFGKIGKWAGDRWGRGPSMKGLKSSIKGTAKFAGKVAPYALGAASLGVIPGIGALGGLASKIPGVGKVTGVLKGIGLGGDPLSSIGEAQNFVSGIGQAASGGGKLRAIGGFLKNHGGDILDGLETAGNIYGNYQDQSRRDDYMRMAKDEFARRAPLRNAGMQALLDDSTPDTSAIFNDPMDPAGRYRRVQVGSRL